MGNTVSNTVNSTETMTDVASRRDDNKFEIKNLNLYYGDFHALKNINMDIKKNQITAFIGPSGCGKSTFLKTLNRMNDLVDNVKIDGDVYLDGKNIFTDMDDITRRMNENSEIAGGLKEETSIFTVL